MRDRRDLFVLFDATKVLAEIAERIRQPSVVVGNSRRPSHRTRCFAEGIGQPRKPAHVHPHGEILPFHVRRGDMISVRIAADDLGFNIDALPAGE